jgi:uncharacterized damage-inducible protein DinB
MKKAGIIKYWQNVRALTLDLLGCFTEEQMSFRPVKGIRSVAEQFDHILAVELYCRKGLEKDVWGPVPTPGLGISDKKELQSRMIREHELTTLAMRVLPEYKFARFFQTPFGKLTGEAAIYLAIDEEIHHRGNLYTYLRLLGRKPPRMVQNYYQLFMEE